MQDLNILHCALDDSFLLLFTNFTQSNGTKKTVGLLVFINIYIPTTTNELLESTGYEVPQFYNFVYLSGGYCSPRWHYGGNVIRFKRIIMCPIFVLILYLKSWLPVIQIFQLKALPFFRHPGSLTWHARSINQRVCRRWPSEFSAGVSRK